MKKQHLRKHLDCKQKMYIVTDAASHSFIEVFF